MIKTEGLAKHFGENRAVDGLDLSIERGEFFCFLGPNGAGKTTTIKMLTGLIRPTSGRAVVGGWDVAREALQAKAIMGYIPDTPYLYEKLTGRELMRFVGGLYSMSGNGFRARCDELLELFEIAHVADRLVEDYSHGMRQKLSFASCFLHEPEVVVVDEPWVGLDPKNIRFVKDFLREKTRQGLTVFMSTHSLAVIEDVADRVGIIHRGRLRHTGTVDAIKALAETPGTLEEVFLKLTEDEGLE